MMNLVDVTDVVARVSRWVASSRGQGRAMAGLVVVGLIVSFPATGFADPPSAPAVESTTTLPYPGAYDASVEAKVNPGGQTTTLFLQYDLASSQWCTSGGSLGTAAYQAGRGTIAATDFSFHLYTVHLVNLTPATSYCAVMVAQNNSGTAHTATPITFWTAPPPPPWAGPPLTGYGVNVAVVGTGSGTVTGGGISCPGICSQTYALGIHVSLSAMPAIGSRFAGWTGACSGTAMCDLVATSNEAVAATFSKNPPRCSLTPSGETVLLRKSQHGQTRKARPASGTLAVTAKCDQAAHATLTGTLTEVATSLAQRKITTFKLRPAHALLLAEHTRVLRISLPAAALAGLRWTARARAILTLAASNANGTGRASATVPRIRGVD
jgi:hypothetical protein